MFEFFFCPVHGILRPDNVGILLQSAYLYLLYAKMYFDRYLGWAL